MPPRSTTTTAHRRWLSDVLTRIGVPSRWQQSVFAPLISLSAALAEVFGSIARALLPTWATGARPGPEPHPRRLQQLQRGGPAWHGGPPGGEPPIAAANRRCDNPAAQVYRDKSKPCEKFVPWQLLPFATTQMIPIY